jgi:Putative phage serine protease XkdF
MTEKELYKITIDPEYSENGEDLGVEQIAFVKNPAVKMKGFAFNSNVKSLAFADEPKMRITAPALIPMDIYRNDEFGEYYVQFTEDEIEKIFSKFMKNLSNKGKFNVEHDSQKESPAYVLEAWLVDKPKEDKAYSSFGLEVPKGTLMVTAQLTDKKFFNDLVKNGQTGFSIEGFLGLKLEEHLKSIEEERLSSNIKNKYATMKLPDGNHEIEGKVYVVKDGEVVEILDKTEMENEMPGGTIVEKDAPIGTEMGDKTPTMLEDDAAAAAAEEDAASQAEAEMEINVEPNAELAPNPGQTSGETGSNEVKMQIDETELMTILQPKFDEIYKMIADLKAATIEDEDEEYPMETVEMSIHQRFSNVVNNYIKK